MSPAPAHPPALTPDLAEASKFLNALDPTAKGFTFQTFDDATLEGGEKRNNKALARIFHGTLEEHAAELTRLNAAKAGIFVTVNETNLRGRLAADTVRRRTVWRDDDRRKVRTSTVVDAQTPIAPNIVVETSPGKYQDYWLVEGLSAEEHAAVLETIVTEFGGDAGAKGVNRVLRLPGFFHMKGAPHPVRIVGGTTWTWGHGKHTRDDVLRAFPPRSVAKARPVKLTGDKLPDACTLDDLTAFEIATRRASQAPPAIEGKDGEPATYELICELGDMGLSDGAIFEVLSKHWAPRCLPPWGDEELQDKIHNGAQYRQNARGCRHPIVGFRPLPDELLPICSRPQEAPALAPTKLLEYPSEIRLDEIIERHSRALVRGLIHPGDFVVVYGNPGAGKSFAVHDQGYAVAHGRDWCGRKTTRAPVLYVALEGVHGMKARVLAANKVHGDPGASFARLAVNISLVKADHGKEGADTIIEAYRQLASRAALASPGMIIIDTKSRATAGDDENDAADVMAFVEQRVAFIIRETGAAVIVVHHTSRAGNLRGHSALDGAADVIIQADKDDVTKLRTLRATKVKDGEEGTLLTYTLETVSLGFHKDGSPITSCVVKAAGTTEHETKCLELTKEVMCKAIAAGERLSIERRARNSAVRFLYKHQPAGSNFTRNDFEKALSCPASLGLRLAKYASKGKCKGSEVTYFELIPASAPVDVSRLLTGAAPVAFLTGAS